MKKLFVMATATLILGLTSQGALSAEVKSLRGDLAIDSTSKMFDKKRQKTVDGKFSRSWKLQPPSIPHKIDKDRISLQENTCMRCHSEENYKKEKAPKIGDSHYIDASGKKLTTLNMRRYFCTQCHTPQMDVKPLVKNNF